MGSDRTDFTDNVMIDKASVATWMRLARVYHKIDKRSAESFRAHGLTVAQFDVLAQVGVREGCTQQELADHLLVTKGNVCQLLDKMEAHGWIERRPVKHGRGNSLYLTEEGQNIRNKSVPAQEQRISHLFSALTTSERSELSRVLRIIDRSLDERNFSGKE
jgi:DNA-binding MarR family transcriptional regulator